MSDREDRIGHHAIEVSDLVKSYGDQVVLDGADLTVEYGEFVALAGASGSGKSTLLNLLAALDSPDSGTIVIDGVTIGGRRRTSLSRYRREHVGIVFQLHNLIPRLTASQNVELAMFGTKRNRSQRIEHAHDMLRKLELGARIDRKPPTLSGGERARVALARGLANDPPVLLADEPTGNLDDVSALAVSVQLRALAEDEGVAVLAVSHDHRLNEQAHRLLRLVDGKLVELDHVAMPRTP